MFLSLHLVDEALRTSGALRIRAPACEPQVCRCSRVVDRFGRHDLECHCSVGQLPCHAKRNDVVKHGLAAACVPSWLDRGDCRRHGGRTVFPYCRGKSLCWDVTYVDTFSVTSVIRSVIESGSPAAGAKARKCTRYQGLVDRCIFQPVTVETTSVLEPCTQRFSQQLGKRISSRTRDKMETVWPFQRKFMEIVRGTAADIT